MSIHNITIAACLIHKHRHDKNDAIYHLLTTVNQDMISTDKFGGRQIIMKGHKISFDNLSGVESLKGISKIENDDLRFLFLDAMVIQLKARQTTRTIFQLFDREKLMHELEIWRGDWMEVLLEKNVV